jgi:choline dehydrogenase
MSTTYDFIIVGAGSAGCAVAHGLAARGAGRVLVVEAGPSDRTPFVKMPFGLVWTLGTRRRDWRFRSTPQEGLGGREVAIPRGRMVGGSGSINSMVWFRGRAADFDAWDVDGWRWRDVAPVFDEVEEAVRPARLRGAHPLTEAFANVFPQNDPGAIPSPDREGSGVFAFNMSRGRRRSAADVFLRPALETGDVHLLTGRDVKRLHVRNGRARAVEFSDGTVLHARRGVVLSAGSIGSPAILMASGIGPAEDVRAAGIDPVLDAPDVGANLHDHPGAGLFYEGPGSGYGLDPREWWRWAAGPLLWLAAGRGVLASPTVEGGGFFNARGEAGAEPDVQSHFIPFRLPHDGRKYALAQGYFADVCVCRPRSRGSLKLGREGLEIDLGLFRDQTDLDTLAHGWMRLRALMAEADLGPHKAPEVSPGPTVQGEEAARAHIRRTAGTAYHPVGTLRMGADAGAPVTPRLALRGIEGLWVADASVMPAVTSANTNAPSMMIGYRAGAMIAADAA